MSLNISSLGLTGKSLVIVEDDLSSIRYYQAFLKDTGAEIKIFSIGQDFIDYIDSEDVKIDLVFIDFLVPLINGIECVRIFRRKRKNTPVLMITAYSSEQTRTEALLAGCNEFLLKPIYPEKLFFLIDKYLNPNISVPFSY
jgi:DNA-binding response OmpR family regulator